MTTQGGRTAQQGGRTAPQMKVFEFDAGLAYIVASDKIAACEEYDSMFGSDLATCRELKDEDLDKYTVQLTDENDELTGTSETFREHLAEMPPRDGSAFYLCGEE